MNAMMPSVLSLVALAAAGVLGTSFGEQVYWRLYHTLYYTVIFSIYLCFVLVPKHTPLCLDMCDIGIAAAAVVSVIMLLLLLCCC